MLKRSLCAALIITHLAACTSMATMPVAPGQMGSTVNVGDYVLTSSKNGLTREFAVTRVTNEEICGAGECIGTNDLATLQRREVADSRGTSATAVILAVVGVSAIVFLTAGRALGPLFKWN